MTKLQQTAERRATIEDSLARQPRIKIAFKTVSGNTADFYALSVLVSALTGGQSSRLFQKIVREKELVTSINARMNVRRGIGAYPLTAILRVGKNPTEIEAIIYEEIERLKTEAIAEWELQKAKSNARRGFVNALQNSLNREQSISAFTRFIMATRIWLTPGSTA